MHNCLKNTLKLRFESYVTAVKFESYVTAIKNYSQVCKNYPFTWFLYWKLPVDTDLIHFIFQFHESCGINARECSHEPAVPQQGMLGALIVWWPASFWLQYGQWQRALCMLAVLLVPNQTHRGMKKWKMYTTKQIKICAEYRDMLPRPRLDLSGTPGLRPIFLTMQPWPG